MPPQLDPRLLNLAWLKANHRTIHYFGLGFIQLKLDESRRMHFYVPSLKPTTVLATCAVYMFVRREG